MEFVTETDLLGMGRLHDHLLQPVALDSYQSPVVLLAFVLRREPIVQVEVLRQVVLLVIRLMIALVIKVLGGLSSTCEAHDSSLQLDATLFLHNCCCRG